MAKPWSEVRAKAIESGLVTEEGVAATREKMMFEQKLHQIIDMAHREADSGAPGGMVAVYVELAIRHLIANHDGAWSNCGPCHAALNRDSE